MWRIRLENMDFFPAGASLEQRRFACWQQPRAFATACRFAFRSFVPDVAPGIPSTGSQNKPLWNAALEIAPSPFVATDSDADTCSYAVKLPPQYKQVSHAANNVLASDAGGSAGVAALIETSTHPSSSSCVEPSSSIGSIPVVGSAGRSLISTSLLSSQMNPASFASSRYCAAQIPQCFETPGPGMVRNVRPHRAD